MGQNHTVGKTATSVRRDPDGTIRVVYHSTEVVRAEPSGVIHLNTGGWFSNTTKARMNQAASQFGLGFLVSQKDFNWSVRVLGPECEWSKAKVIPFDGYYIVFNRNTGEALSI